MKLHELQAAFFNLQAAIERLEGRSPHGLVLAVFKDGDPRVDSTEWLVEAEDVPVVLMSDGLYALYCASLDIVNTNMRGFETA